MINLLNDTHKYDFYHNANNFIKEVFIKNILRIDEIDFNRFNYA